MANALFQDDPPRLLAYSVKSALAWIQNRQYRNEILQRLVKMYSTLPRPDFINMCQVKAQIQLVKTSSIDFFDQFLVLDLSGRSSKRVGNFGKISQGF